VLAWQLLLLLLQAMHILFNARPDLPGSRAVTDTVYARESPASTYGAAVEVMGVAGHCGKPCRMSLYCGLKGNGAWLMLCV
jgi:hypothetical protein